VRHLSEQAINSAREETIFGKARGQGSPMRLDIKRLDFEKHEWEREGDQARATSGVEEKKESSF